MITNRDLEKDLRAFWCYSYSSISTTYMGEPDKMGLIERLQIIKWSWKERQPEG